LVCFVQYLRFGCLWSYAYPSLESCQCMLCTFFVHKIVSEVAENDKAGFLFVESFY
jgi:hypothetical protein